jgi:hypothetical protein
MSQLSIVRHFHSYLLSIFSSFSSLIIGIFTNNPKASPPWSRLSQDTSHEYVSAECLPPSVFLQDPSKMRSSGINAYWTHWMARQEDGETGLVFSKAIEADMRAQHIGQDDAESSSHKRGPTKKQGSAEGNKGKESRGDGDESDSEAPHPDSPAAHAMNRSRRRKFLKGLSDNKAFQRWMKHMLHAKVGFILHSMWCSTKCSQEKGAALPKSFPHEWASWEYSDKYLPRSFHSLDGLPKLMAVAQERHEYSYESAEFIALAMGLACREVSRVDAMDHDNVPEETPEWVVNSIVNMENLALLMKEWRGVDESGDPTPTKGGAGKRGRKDVEDDDIENDDDPSGNPTSTKGRGKRGRKKNNVEDDEIEVDDAPSSQALQGGRGQRGKGKEKEGRVMDTRASKRKAVESDVDTNGR